MLSIKMHFTRIVIIVASLVGILSIFLPWVNIPIVGSLSGSKSFSYVAKMGGNASVYAYVPWVLLVVFIVFIVLAIVIGVRSKVLRPAFRFSILGVNVVLLVECIDGLVRYHNTIKAMSNVKDDPFGIGKAMVSTISLQAGVPLLIIAIVVMIIICSLPQKLMNKITTDVDADATGEPEASAKPVNKKKVLTIVGIIVAVIVLGVGGTMGVRSFQRYEAVQAAKAKMAKAEKVAKNTDPGKLFKKLSKTEQDKLFYQAFLDYAKIIKNDVFQSQEYADSIYDELIYDDTEDKTSGHTWTATEIDGIKGGLDSYTDGLSTDDVPKDVKALIKDETQDVADKLFANIRKEYIKEFGK